MYITVKVEKSHIKKGCARDSTGCPIYLAINKFINKEVIHQVGCTRLNMRKKKQETAKVSYVKLPSTAQDFISSFDQNPTIAEPITFKLNIPKKFLKEKYHVSTT